MAIAVETVALKYLDVSAGVSVSVAIPAFEATDIFVYYGSASLTAEQVVDYTLTLAEDFSTFSVTPTASLIAKIDALIAADATETNFIVVRRTLDYKTDATPAGVRYTPFTSREFERTVMRMQQMEERVNRAVLFPEKIVGDTQQLEIDDIVADRVIVVNNDGTALVASSYSLASLAADVAAVAASEAATAADVAAVAASEAATAADAVATAADRVQTGLDRTAAADSAALAAAGIHIVEALASPVPDNGTQEALIVDEGLRLYEVQTGAWVAIGWIGRVEFDTFAELQASTYTTFGGDGTIVQYGPYRAQEVASGEHFTTAGGVKWLAIPDYDGFYTADQVGIAVDGLSDVGADIVAAAAKFGSLRLNGIFAINGQYSATVSKNIVIDATNGILNYTSGALVFTNEAKVTSTVAANAVQYDTAVTLDATGAAIGDMVHIGSDVAVSNDFGAYKVNQVRRVKSISGAILTLDDGLEFAVAVADTAQFANVYTPRYFRLIGGKFTGQTVGMGYVTAEFFCDVHSYNMILSGPSSMALTDIHPRGFTAWACDGVSVVSPTMTRIAYGIIPTVGTRKTVISDIVAAGCRHPVDPAVWADGVTVIGIEASGCYQTVSSHPALNVTYYNVNAVGEWDYPNLRSVGGRISNCRVALHPDAALSAGRCLMHVTTLEAAFLALWDNATLVIDGLEVTQDGAPIGTLDLGFGHISLSNIAAGKIYTRNTVKTTRIGSGMERIGLKKYGDPTDVALYGIRSTPRIDRPCRVDARADGSNKIIPLSENLVDQAAKSLRAYGTISENETPTARRLVFQTSAFAALDTPTYIVGKLRMTGFVKHSSGSGFDVATYEWSFNHKIGATSTVTLSTTPVLARNAVATNSLTLTMSAVQQEGVTELGAAKYFNISFLLTPATAGASPTMTLTYEIELAAMA